VIVTRRLVLRPPADEQAGAIAHLMTPSLSQWLASWPSPVSEDDVRQRIRKARLARDAGIEASWLVHLRDSDVVIGWVHIARESTDMERAELGYWIGDHFRGHGYATEAAQSALAAVFQRWQIAVVESGAQVGNIASFVVMRKLGMTLVGERMVWAPARGRDELCRFFAIRRVDYYGPESTRPGATR
jgi:ribosomal-protein-alanine N-acetyltransferase